MELMMAKINFQGFTLDSPEEAVFLYWLIEAREAGLITDYHRPTGGASVYRPLNLSDLKRMGIDVDSNPKVKDRTAIPAHTNKWDFEFTVTPLFRKFFPRIPINYYKIGLGYSKGNVVYVDVKGFFSRFHDRNLFHLKQQILLREHQKYVNEVKVETSEGSGQGWLYYTWVPEALFWTDWNNPWENKVRDIKKRRMTQANEKKGIVAHPMWEGYRKIGDFIQCSAF
jgi:hypothetical protein